MESVLDRRIDSDLDCWGIWANRESGEVKGYPSEATFYRFMRGKSVASSLPVTDSRMERVDRAVSRLGQRCPDQKYMVELHYRERKNVSVMARLLGRSRTSIADDLRMARNAIEWILDGMEDSAA